MMTLATCVLLLFTVAAHERVVTQDKNDYNGNAGDDARPNIVFILTDDQDRAMGRNSSGYSPLGGLEVMPATRKHLAEAGATFDNFFVNTPICCPSRAEFFTGRYFHNVKTSTGGCMHADTSEVAGTMTGMFGLLTSSGYNTGVFGKVTNDQGSILKAAAAQGSMVTIDSPLDYNSYMGTSYFHRSRNGTTWTENIGQGEVPFGTAYQTTQIGNRTLRWLREAMRGPAPFFAYIGPHAPHFPAQPAPWYEDALPDIEAPRTPNYNVSCPDKPQHIRQNAGLTELARCWENKHFRDRWSSLLSVDDIVQSVVEALDEGGVLNKTYIVYTSDHGYKFGQWRVGTSKQHPYETDVRVPFLIRGPGIEAGTVISELTGNVDLLPTFLELAGVAEWMLASDGANNLDGRSMAPLLLSQGDEMRGSMVSSRPAAWRTSFLNEYWSVGTYYNDHSQAWQNGNETSESCGGDMPRGPAGAVDKCVEETGVGDGECYFVDSELSNSWRSLRIINSTHDLTYVEYDSSETYSWESVSFHELYDNSADPFQLSNIYDASSANVKLDLAGQLSAWYQCKGDSCP